MKKLITFSVLLILSVSSFAQSYTGRAVNVSDGDTFTLLLSDNTTIRIRLYGIDCPEKGQDFGNKAKDFTKRYLNEKTIVVEQKDTDRYGRVVGIAICGGCTQSLNEELLKAGFAWHYTHYDQNPKWEALAQAARNARIGLWQQSDAIAPWEFRKAKREIYH